MHYSEQERKLHQTPVRIFSTIENAPKHWSKTSRVFNRSFEHF